MEKLGGFVKDNDYVEYKLIVPKEVPEKYMKVARVVESRYNLHTIKFTRKMVYQGGYGQKMFELINESFKDLYGYSEMTPRQIRQYLPSGNMEQGPDDAVPPLRDPRQAPEPRAPGHVKKHGLGIVVFVVGGGDEVGAPPVRGPAEKGVAQLPGGGLGAQAVFLRVERRVPPFGDELHAPPGAQSGHEGRVLPGLRPQAVVEVGAGARHVAQVQQRAEHAHRVGPAGHRTEHPAARGDQPPVDGQPITHGPGSAGRNPGRRCTRPPS